MDAWPASTGEALHTQTFLGHPLGCVASLASIRVFEQEGLAARAARSGELALEHLGSKLAGRAAVTEVRGLGLMLGVELERPEHAVAAVQRCLQQGVIVLPSGDGGRVVSVTPPLAIEEDALLAALDVVIDAILGTDP